MWHTLCYTRPNIIPSYDLKVLECLAPKYTVNNGIGSQSHICLTSKFLKRSLFFSLQDKQNVEEASGEGPAQQGEVPKVEMESWQKECDSLRKVTKSVQAVIEGRLRGKKILCTGKEP